MTEDRDARAKAHELMREAFAPRGSEEPGIIFCGAHTGGEVFHTKLCDTLTAFLLKEVM